MKHTIKVHEIGCDDVTCTDVIRHHGDTMGDAIREARDFHWSIGKRGDFCPDHAHLTKKKKR